LPADLRTTPRPEERIVPLVSVFSRCSSHPFPLKVLQSRAQRLLAHELPAAAPVFIVLCGNRFIRTLNNKYRKKDRPTDVLSFNFNDPDLLGEIYISLEKARSQAREYGISLKQEVWRLATHGLFHLLGYTHHKKRDRVIMQRKEACYH